MSAAGTKVQRQRLIRRILASEQPRSQKEIVESLAGSGMQVTQATVSRDLEELGAVRVPSGGYRLRPTPAVSGPVRAIRRVLAGSVVTVAASGDMVVVKTLAGHAQFVASVFDDADLSDVVGTVGGDDTILVVAAPRRGKKVADELKLLSGLGDEGD